MGGNHRSATQTENISSTKRTTALDHRHVKNNQTMNDYLNDHTTFTGEDVLGDNEYYEDLVNQGGTMIIKLMNLDDLDLDGDDDHELDMIVSKKHRKMFKKKLGATTCDILYNEAHQNPLFNSKSKKGVEFRTRLQTKLADYC